ncbi:MAG: hypothetical protein NPINA01_13800 [Nitrospinaceae bacterium]|nr:MAG: hypothetical protein NPINA01_13800 [Nitrospinaceae bacterium]
MGNTINKIDFDRENSEIAGDILHQTKTAEDIDAFIPGLMEDLKDHFDCEAITLFAVDYSTHQLFSKNHVSPIISEIRVDISLNSLAGFVAGTGNSLNIIDVNDKEELVQYHPQLTHEDSWDDLLDFKTKSVIAVPLPYNRNLIGVLEIVNKKNNGYFSLVEFQFAKNISTALGWAVARMNNHVTAQDNPVSEKTEPDSSEPNTDNPQATEQEESEKILNSVTIVKRDPEEVTPETCEPLESIERSVEKSDCQAPPMIVSPMKKVPVENNPEASDPHQHSEYSPDKNPSNDVYEVAPDIEETPTVNDAAESGLRDQIDKLHDEDTSIEVPEVALDIEEQPTVSDAEESELQDQIDKLHDEDMSIEVSEVVPDIEEAPPENNIEHLESEHRNFETESYDENKKNPSEEEFQKLLESIKANPFSDNTLKNCQSSIRKFFDAEIVILYRFNQAKNELYVSPDPDNQIPEIHLPISPSSIAGYAALIESPINIADVTHPEELSTLHPELRSNGMWDDKFNIKTAEILAVPLIQDKTLLGVLQFLNKKGPGPFTQNDNKNATALAESFAHVIFKRNREASENATPFSYLIENGLITEKALASSIAHAERSNLEVESVLLKQVEIKREDLGLSLANFYDLPYFGFRNSVILPQKIIGGLNKNFLAKNYWIPIKSDDSKVVILINDPGNQDKLQNIKHIFSRKEVEFKIGLKVDIIDYLNSVLEQGEAKFEDVKSENMSSLINTLQEKPDSDLCVTSEKDEAEEIQTVKETDSATIRLVNKILIDAYEREASDIHFEPGVGKENLLIRFRKEGECHAYEEIPAIYKQGIISRIKIMAQLDIAEKRLPQDGKFKARYGGKEVEFRVATCPTVGGNEDAVLRILAQSQMNPLEKMNFSSRNLELIKNTIVKPYGLVLVVGPTGSGKTTTLHSCLNLINTPKKKIWTAEDPVEITQKGLRQVQMLEKKGLNFARAMRSFLRGDPDVIMVGEMRDKETADIGLEASLTGHLVFTTLHTNSAPETITRLLDMGMNPLNFADSLLLIIAQRLVKTLCKECAEDYHPSIEEYDILVKEYGPEHFEKLGIEYNNDLTLKRAKGCQVCEKTGYLGRTAIHEVLEGTLDINRLIVKQGTVEQLRTQAMQEGMTTLKQDGIQKIFNGDCDLKQVLSVCTL